MSLPVPIMEGRFVMTVVMVFNELLTISLSQLGGV